jgi:replicative DNA helicase
MLVTPVTLRPLFRGGRRCRSWAGRAISRKLTADGQGLIGPRDLAEQIYDLALLRELVASGAGWSKTRSTPANRSTPSSRSSRPRPRFTRWPKGRGEREAQSSSPPPKRDRRMSKRRSIQRRASFGQVTTGLDSINAKIGGLHDSDLIILAGRPGMGKTSLATNIAFNAAQRCCATARTGSTKSRGRAKTPSSASK